MHPHARLSFRFPDYLLYIPLNLHSRQHHFAPAPFALNAKIHAHAQHLKTHTSAGVLLLGHYHIAHVHIHQAFSPPLSAGVNYTPNPVYTQTNRPKIGAKKTILRQQYSMRYAA
jgi:hypothetical protein